MHNFPCPLCPRSFNRRARLDRHLCAHTGVRPFACTVPGCAKSFTRKDHLKRHVESSHPAAAAGEGGGSGDGTPPPATMAIASPPVTGYKCEWAGCGSLLLSLGRLERHVLQHVATAPRHAVWCPMCPKATRPVLLGQHQLAAHYMSAHGMGQHAAAVQARLVLEGATAAGGGARPASGGRGIDSGDGGSEGRHDDDSDGSEVVEVEEAGGGGRRRGTRTCSSTATAPACVPAATRGHATEEEEEEEEEDDNYTFDTHDEEEGEGALPAGSDGGKRCTRPAIVRGGRRGKVGSVHRPGRSSVALQVEAPFDPLLPSELTAIPGLMQVLLHACPFPGCDQTFPTHRALQVHTNHEHSGQVLVCPACGKDFTRPQAYTRHVSTCLLLTPDQGAAAGDGEGMAVAGMKRPRVVDGPKGEGQAGTSSSKRARPLGHARQETVTDGARATPPSVVLPVVQGGGAIGGVDTGEGGGDWGEHSRMHAPSPCFAPATVAPHPPRRPRVHTFDGDAHEHGGAPPSTGGALGRTDSGGPGGSDPGLSHFLEYVLGVGVDPLN